MQKIKVRNVSPILAAVRDVLLGRPHKTAHRYGEEYAARTQPPPDLPEGPAHILSANYYYSRDGRREVAPPVAISDSKTKQIEAPSKDGSIASGAKTPGKIWHWD
uniref:NADH dehydrogenase [ubiquinone] 1 alpha subcomplex subunit 7 n=1 Tax=Clastoptera arizonana TaxID=38151 RepID=A0A1B6CYH8_9HEMI